MAFPTSVLSLADAHTRVRTVLSSGPAPATNPVPPDGKCSDLWWRLFENAQVQGHPDPERWADSALRQRERTLAVQSQKRKTVALSVSEAPKVPSGSVVPTRPTGPLCTAKTLEGKPCRFKATCGSFCKKHFTNNLKLV